VGRVSIATGDTVHKDSGLHWDFRVLEIYDYVIILEFVIIEISNYGVPVWIL
jgi:hypothetical protein